MFCDNGVTPTEQSDPIPLKCGVPQGSLLDPLIFNVYTAPLMNIVRRHSLSYHKYADDMQIYGDFDPASDANRQYCQQRLQECLAEVRAWMLKINCDKNGTDGVHDSPTGQVIMDRAADHYSGWLHHHYHSNSVQPWSHNK